MLKIKKHTPEEQQELRDFGLTEYQGHFLPHYLNPTTYTYWFVHIPLFISTIAYRIYLRKFINAPHGFSTFSIFAVGYSIYRDQFRYDYLHMINPWRPISLEDQLETSPIARNAYEKAIQENQQFQNKLKSKIQELKNNVEQ